jgi:endonuclease/exonuclease/phosphatase family metal-dependent hydrolase
MKFKKLLACLLTLLHLPVPAQSVDGSSVDEVHQPLSLLSFEDLVTLSATAHPQGPLAVQLDHVLNTPYVDNSASDAGTPPHHPTVRTLGPVVRVGLWNIERGLNFDLIRAALTDSDAFAHVAAGQTRAKAAPQEVIESQLAALHDVDVLVLNEVDFGMKRTEYRDVARELAAALHMNYAYGVEFVEVDPIFELGIKDVHLPDLREDARLQQDLQVDHRLYRGLHGTAILSRYPISHARILRLPVCYDWYSEESKQIAKLEQGKRWAAHRLFKERIAREVRQGGRMALMADLTIPDLPSGTATIVATHLENRCAPACRRRQMDALVADLQQIRNPVVLAGDLNTTGKTNTPTSVRNEIMSRVRDYQFWIRQTVSYFHPLGIYRHAVFPLHYFHGYNDPTACHLPILWENRERPLFANVKKFRFADDGAFDFRGEPERTLNGRSRSLADSNERAFKGFVPTYAFARDYGGLVGRFKLDWILVKPVVQDPSRDEESYLFAPHFPRTMRELNESVVGRISDHPPVTVDLPLVDQPASTR